MTPLLFQFALSNLLISAVLAGLAYVVHRRGRSPMLAHLLAKKAAARKIAARKAREAAAREAAAHQVTDSSF